MHHYTRLTFSHIFCGTYWSYLDSTILNSYKCKKKNKQVYKSLVPYQSFHHIWICLQPVVGHYFEENYTARRLSGRPEDVTPNNMWNWTEQVREYHFVNFLMFVV